MKSGLTARAGSGYHAASALADEAILMNLTRTLSISLASVPVYLALSGVASLTLGKLRDGAVVTAVFDTTSTYLGSSAQQTVVR